MILEDVTREDIEAIDKEMKKEQKSNSTRRRHILLIGHIFKRAATVPINGLYFFEGRNPVEGIDKPSMNGNERDRFLTEEEVKLLLDTCKYKAKIHTRKSDKESWQTLHDVILLASHSGMRLGEILRLELHELDFDNDIITIKKRKRGKRGGKIPMHPRVKEMFKKRQQKLLNDSKLVFPPRNKKTKYRSSISIAFRKLVNDDLDLNKEAIGLQDRIVFHTLRHSFASWLAQQGTPINKIKELMRHSSLTMTFRYAHLLPEHLRKELEGINLK